MNARQKVRVWRQRQEQVRVDRLHAEGTCLAAAATCAAERNRETHRDNQHARLASSPSKLLTAPASLDRGSRGRGCLQGADGRACGRTSMQSIARPG